jgi:poly(beta-D-mannuronate) lyase
LTWPNRDRLDLAAYKVTDRNAGLLDVRARAELLDTTVDPTLRQAIEAVLAASAELDLDPSSVTYVGPIPRFYHDRDAWHEATRDLRAIETTVGVLAAAFLASGDRSHADRLLDLLTAWADQDALTCFHYAPEEPQAWFSLEATLLALGLSYAVVRPFTFDQAEERTKIEAWLARASRTHLAVDRQQWNNHYYRRAVHAASIGVVAGDDELFRFGLSAIHNALAELRPEGALPREVARGGRAVHYQNYAVLYLMPIFQIAARQGYSLWELAPTGRTIHDAVDVTLELLADPGLARRYTAREQDLSFMAHGMYFAWMEIFCARFPDARLEAFVQPYRPVWSRSSIGAATLYFYEPRRTGAGGPSEAAGRDRAGP